MMSRRPPLTPSVVETLASVPVPAPRPCLGRSSDLSLHLFDLSPRDALQDTVHVGYLLFRYHHRCPGDSRTTGMHSTLRSASVPALFPLDEQKQHPELLSPTYLPGLPPTFSG